MCLIMRISLWGEIREGLVAPEILVGDPCFKT